MRTFLLSLLSLLLFHFSLTAQDNDGCLSFFIETENAMAGDLVCVDLKVESFQSIQGAQFSILWDFEKIEFDTLLLNEEAANILKLEIDDFNIEPSPNSLDLSPENVLIVEWFKDLLPSISLPDSTSLFQICFLVKEEATGFAPIYFSDTLTNFGVASTTNFTNTQLADAFQFRSGGVWINQGIPGDPLTLSTSCTAFSNCTDTLVNFTPQLSGGVPPYTIVWRDEDQEIVSTDSLVNVPDGVYFLKVTDLNGEQLSFIYDFDVSELEVITMITEIDCSLDIPGNISASAAGGSGYYDYNWSTGGSNASITGLEAGVYALTLTDRQTNCSIIDTFELLANAEGIDAELTYECILSPSDSFVRWSATQVQVDNEPFELMWESGQNSSTDSIFIIPQTGDPDVRLSITDALGCTQEYRKKASCAPEDIPMFSIPDERLAVEEEKCINITTSSNIDILGFDWVIEWDTNAVTFLDDLLENISFRSIASIEAIPAEGAYYLSVRFQEAERFLVGSPLLSLCFRGKGISTSSLLRFSPIQTKVILDDGRIVRPKYENGHIAIKASTPMRLEWSIGLSVELSDTLCVPFRSRGFDTISSLQYSMSWDTTSLEFLEVRNFIFPDSSESGEWTIAVSDTGTMRFVGYDVNGLSLAQDEVNYELCFLPKRLVDFTRIRPELFELPLEALNTALQSVGINLRSGAIQIIPDRPALSLGVGSRVGLEGKTFCTPILGTRFEEVDQLTFTTRWDTSFLELTEIRQASDIPFFAFPLTSWDLDTSSVGVLNASWMNPPISFENTERILELCFFAKKAGNTIIQYDSVVQARSKGELAIPELNSGYIEIQPDLSEMAVEFVLPDTSVAVGRDFCMPVRVSNFNFIAALQYTHRWDPGVLSFKEFQPGDLTIGPNDYFLNPSEGALGLFWISFDTLLNSGISLPDSSILYKICFEPAGGIGDFSQVWLDDSVINFEIITGSALQELPHVVDTGTVSLVENFVWPGDTDNDGVVNQFDLLNIGIGIGATGPPRAEPGNISWQPFSAEDWDLSTPETKVNYKHIDTDGNGSLELADTLAILENWNQTTPWYVEEPPGLQPNIKSDRRNGVPFFVEADGTVELNDNQFDLVLGTAEQPVTAIYGLAFSIYLNNEGFEFSEVRLNFSESWMGTLGENAISIQRFESSSNRLDVAITRIDGQDVSGMGPIGQLKLNVASVVGLDGLNDDQLTFRIANVRMINVEEQEQEVEPVSSSVDVNIGTTGANEPYLEKNITIFPNPASRWVQVRANEVYIRKIRILDAVGRVVYAPIIEAQVNLSGLASGQYYLQIETDRGTIVKSLVLKK